MNAKDVARAVNERIRELAQRFETERTRPVGFLCECGCFELVALTLAEYDARGGTVLAAGHAAS